MGARGALRGPHLRLLLPRDIDNRTPLPYFLKMLKVRASANRRYLAAIKALAQVRKLQANTPAVQFNTQINLSE